MVKRGPVYDSAGSCAVVVLPGCHHYAFQCKIILVQRDLVHVYILGNQDFFSIGHISEAGYAYGILSGRDILDDELSLGVRECPLFGRRKHHGGIFDRFAGLLVKHDSLDRPALGGKSCID